MQEQLGQQEQRFEFYGKGWEYFRIWIVNLLLTILTLGIYSAWAKVRRLQYFYRNTRLAGASFDYHGQPKAILKGRIIAFGLLLLYNVTLKINPAVGLGVGLLLAVVMPWLLMRSLRFKLYNSSYRGLRFGFAGQTGGAYSAFLGYPFLAAMTIYLLAPLAHQRIKLYQMDNSRFGTTAFKFAGSVKGFYLLYLSALVAVAGTVMFIIALALMSGTGIGSKAIASGFAAAGPKLLTIGVAAILIISSLFIAYMQNLVWGNMTVGAHRVFSQVSARKLLWIRISNFFGILLTLGLFTPFADIRILRLKLESMGVAVSGDLSDFVAGQQQQVSATGEETAEMFDVDISF